MPKSIFLKFVSAFVCALSVIMAPATAFAAERALADIVGYSEDGRYFAFEEFGVQDGSGFAFSTYYIIDLEEDRWVVGTPIAEIGETEEETLAEIRAKSAADAAARLDDLGIHVPAQFVAGVGDGAIGADGSELAFGLPRFSSPGSVSGQYVLSLQEFDAGSASPCFDWFGTSAKGFLAKLSDGDEVFEVHRDTVLPRSRGCPDAYRIYAVYAPFEARDMSASVALISVYPHGFEGLDRRFIALPLANAQNGM